MSRLPAISEWVEFKYTDLFNIERGKSCSVTYAKENHGLVPFISASKENNGLTAMTDIDKINSGNQITVANSGNGGVGYAFYHRNDFAAASTVNILTPKFELNKYTAIFLTVLIKLERPKYGFGRGWTITRMRDSMIKLPAADNEPDWELIEAYIKDLKGPAMEMVNEVFMIFRDDDDE